MNELNPNLINNKQPKMQDVQAETAGVIAQNSQVLFTVAPQAETAGVVASASVSASASSSSGGFSANA